MPYVFVKDVTLGQHDRHLQDMLDIYKTDASHSQISSICDMKIAAIGRVSRICCVLSLILPKDLLSDPVEQP